MIGCPAGVGVMLDDPEIGAMAGEAIEDIGRFMRGGRDHIDVVRPALIGNMGIEAKAMIDAIAGVDVAARCAALRAPEELAIRTGGSAVAPYAREWQAVMRVDEDGQRRAVAVVADIGVMGLQELIARHALACGGHARQAEIGGIGEDGGELIPS